MSNALLGGEEGPAVVVNEAGASPFLIVCEHAGKRIPKSLGTLGLKKPDLSRHIAWDIGGEGVSRKLSQLLDAALVMQRYSRLVYDCNRPPESPGAMPEVSETTEIPGNRGLTPEARAARVAEIYEPFHRRLAGVIDKRIAKGLDTILVAIHSFTPVYKGVRRYLDFGVLHDDDARAADLVIELAQRWRDIVTRRNEPYGPADGVCHTLNLHTGARKLPGVMFEIRNDLVSNDMGEAVWAGRLAALLEDLERRAGETGLVRGRVAAG